MSIQDNLAKGISINLPPGVYVTKDSICLETGCVIHGFTDRTSDDNFSQRADSNATTKAMAALSARYLRNVFNKSNKHRLIREVGRYDRATPGVINNGQSNRRKSIFP